MAKAAVFIHPRIHFVARELDLKRRELAKGIIEGEIEQYAGRMTKILALELTVESMVRDDLRSIQATGQIEYIHVTGVADKGGSSQGVESNAPVGD